MSIWRPGGVFKSQRPGGAIGGTIVLSSPIHGFEAARFRPALRGAPVHIPDHYLSPATCALLGGVMVPVWAGSARRVQRQVARARMPLLGIGAAFAFLVMMFNVPAPGGTTVHAVGGTLIAALLGPWAACLSLSVALLVQALLFGDGGILALGANCFNMACVIPFLGYFIYRFLADRLRSELAALGLAAYVALNAAALCAAIEFGIQPALAHDLAGLPIYCPYPLALAIPGMLLPHLLVAGFVEALFTVAVFAFIRRVAPDSIHSGARIRAGYGLLAILAGLSPLGLLAAGTAWGEWSPAEIKQVLCGGHPLGFVPAGLAQGFSPRAALKDYAITGLPPWAGYLLSALAGAALLVIAFKLLSRLKPDPAQPS
jgi:cobalt/nickel transport system permease protein